jgi:signal transduction histidine kinase
VSEQLEDLTQVKEPVNSAVYVLETNFLETAFSSLGYAATGDPKLLEAYQTLLDDYANTRAGNLRGLDSVRSAQLAAYLRNGFARFHAASREQMSLRDQQASAMQALFDELEALEELLTGRIEPSIRADDPVAYRRLQAALEMQIQVNALTKGLVSYLLTGEARFESQVRNADERFRHFFEVYRLVLLSDREHDWAAELRKRSNETLRLAASIVALEKDRRQQLTAFLAAYRDLGRMLTDGLQVRTERNLAVAKAELLEAGETTNTRILLVLAVSLLFGIGAAVLTTQSITKPLRHLTSVMQAVAQGDWQQRVRPHGSDEFRFLGDTFNVMTDRLVHEITEQKKLHGRLEEAERERLDGLKMFAGSIQRAQEEERSRIARELHDDLCQRLTGMKFQVEVLEDEVRPLNRRLGQQLGDVRSNLDESIGEVRRISSNLRPSVLDDFGLVPALKLLCKDFERVHPIPAALEVGEDPAIDLDPEAETALYRIAQEAMANVAKHAEASSVVVRLERRETNVVLQVRDDGHGFHEDPSIRTPRAGHGFGLLSMRERSELLGGRFAVESVPGEGTTVTVVVPVRSEDGHGENPDPHRG